MHQNLVHLLIEISACHRVFLHTNFCVCGAELLACVLTKCCVWIRCYCYRIPWMQLWFLPTNAPCPPADVEFAVLATGTTVITFTAKQRAIAAVRLTVALYANLDVSYYFPFDNLSNFTMTGTRIEQLTTALPISQSASPRYLAVYDPVSRRIYLIDTDAGVSVLRFPRLNKLCPQQLKLVVANSTSITTYSK